MRGTKAKRLRRATSRLEAHARAKGKAPRPAGVRVLRHVEPIDGKLHPSAVFVKSLDTGETSAALVMLDAGGIASVYRRAKRGAL